MRRSNKMFIQTYHWDSEINIKHRISSEYSKHSYRTSRLEQELMLAKNLIHLS